MQLPWFDHCCIACADSPHPPAALVGDAPPSCRWQTGIAPPLRQRMAMGEDGAAAIQVGLLARAPCSDVRCRATGQQDVGIATEGRSDDAIARAVTDAFIGASALPHRDMAPQE